MMQKDFLSWEKTKSKYPKKGKIIYNQERFMNFQNLLV